jgi:hypothetical protein
MNYRQTDSVAVWWVDVMSSEIHNTFFFGVKKKGKTIPVTGHGGP